MIDIHCHVLPGIDDGPRTLEESMDLIRAAVAAGTSTIVATPHVSPQYPNDSGTIVRLAQEVNLRARQDGIGLRVLTGAEIAMTRAADLAPEELNAMALAGGGWLLIECPFSPVATGLQALVGTLQDEGYRILLAHPERCPAFHRDPDILRSLSRSGALSSITAGSLVGRFGSTVRRFAFELVAAGLAHNVASDAHDCVQRRPGGLAELEQSGLSPLADWLTRDVPAAILTDRPIPPRPAVTLEHASWRPRRRWPSRR